MGVSGNPVMRRLTHSGTLITFSTLPCNAHLFFPPLSWAAAVRPCDLCYFHVLPHSKKSPEALPRCQSRCALPSSCRVSQAAQRLHSSWKSCLNEGHTSESRSWNSKTPQVLYANSTPMRSHMVFPLPILKKPAVRGKISAVLRTDLQPGGQD